MNVYTYIQYIYVFFYFYFLGSILPPPLLGGGIVVFFNILFFDGEIWNILDSCLLYCVKMIDILAPFSAIWALIFQYFGNVVAKILPLLGNNFHFCSPDFSGCGIMG